ncbi:unnamed protein product [Ixodes pacificus]
MFIILVCLLNPTKCATKVEMSQDCTLGGQTPLCSRPSNAFTLHPLITILFNLGSHSDKTIMAPVIELPKQLKISLRIKEQAEHLCNTQAPQDRFREHQCGACPTLNPFLSQQLRNKRYEEVI